MEEQSWILSTYFQIDSREDVESKLPSGLVKGHAYSLNGADVVSIRNSWQSSIRQMCVWVL